MKTILAYLLILNLVFSPVYIYFVINNLNRKYHIDDYQLLEVKINDIKKLRAGKRSYDVYIKYHLKNDSTKKDNVTFLENSKADIHFSSLNDTIYHEIFKSKTRPDIGDYIWVWHNDNSEDFYAYGKNDTFQKSKKYIDKTLIIFIPLLLLAITTLSLGFRKKTKK